MKTDAYKPQHLKPKKRRLLTTGSLLCYLLIAVVMSTGASFSKYTTSVSGSDSARVARFEVELGSQATTMNFNESGKQVEAENYTYPFTVTSNSEVAVNYSVTVTFNNAPPATVSLWIDEGTKVVGDGAATEFTFSGFEYPIGDPAKSHKLYVEVAYVDTEGKLVEPFNGTAKIAVTAEQID